MKIIDAHSHVDYISYKYQDGVVGTICCAVDEFEWQSLTDITNQDNHVYGAFGIHPWFVNNVKDGFEKRLESLLKNNSNYMVGEIGVDKYKPNIDEQIEVFKKQFKIAVVLQRPVFLHCVGAWDKIFNVLKQYKKSELPIIIAHDFHGSHEILNHLLNNYNFMFSFNKIDKDQDLYRIQQIPIENILVETDGKSDVLLDNIINKISQIKNDINVCDIIYSNTQRILKHVQIKSY